MVNTEFRRLKNPVDAKQILQISRYSLDGEEQKKKKKKKKKEISGLFVEG